MDYDGLLALVKARRSIRAFKSDPVPDDLTSMSSSEFKVQS